MDFKLLFTRTLEPFCFAFFSALKKCPNYAILKVPNFVLEFSFNRFTCIKGQKHFYFLLTFHITTFFNDSQMTHRMICSLYIRPFREPTLIWLAR